MSTTTSLPKNKALWEKSIEGFKKLYDGRQPSTAKDWARVAHIYTVSGGEFRNQESIIPFTIKESLHEEGVLDSVKSALLKVFKNPVILGIALYFLNGLIKKHR